MERVPLVGFVGLVVVFSIAGWVELRRLRRRHPDLNLDNALSHARHLYLAVPAVGVFGGVQLLLWLEPGLSWSMPLWLEYSYTAVIWAGIACVFAYVFALTVALAFVIRHRRRWPLLFGAVFLLGSIELVQRHYTAPIAPALHHAERDGVILQSSPATCVSASAANLLRLHGVELTERELASRLHTTRSGTTSAQLIYGLRDFGLACRRELLESRDVMQMPTPSILFVHSRTGDGHAVVFAGGDADGRAILLDPLVGRRRVAPSLVTSMWNGTAVTCRRSS